MATRSTSTVEIGGDLTFDHFSTLDLGLYFGIAPLKVAGHSSFDGLLYVSFLDSLLADALGTYDLIQSRNYEGTFSSFGFGGLGAWRYARVAYNVDGVQVAVVVPEPASYALLLTGLAALGWGVRRRKRED
jgi:hypothetical protein